MKKKMDWEYLDNLIEKNKIIDLTKDNTDILISEFNLFLKKGYLGEIYERIKTERDTNVDLLAFEGIEKEETGIVIKFKSQKFRRTNVSLKYDSYPKFAVLKNVPAGSRLPPTCFLPIGVYVSYCTPKPIGPGALFGWEKEIDPNRRLEYVFLENEPKLRPRG